MTYSVLANLAHLEQIKLLGISESHLQPQLAYQHCLTSEILMRKNKTK